MSDDWIDPGPNASVELARPCHPGELLRSWMEGHRETAQATARRLGISRATLHRVLSGRGRLTPELAVRLEELGWSDADFWCRLQSQWEIARVRREREAA